MLGLDGRDCQYQSNHEVQGDRWILLDSDDTGASTNLVGSRAASNASEISRTAEDCSKSVWTRNLPERGSCPWKFRCTALTDSPAPNMRDRPYFRGPSSSLTVLLGRQMCAQSPWGIKRRSSRVTLDIPVEVYGRGPDERIFHEKTRTLVVNAHGGLFPLTTAVAIGQMIVLACEATHQEIQCRVTYRKETAEGGAHLFGVEFDTPSPKFWGVNFPPEDWNAAERKLPPPRSTT